MGERGSSLVESMVAFALLAGASVALFPVFIMAKKNVKYASAKALCESSVRSVLEQYRQGRSLDMKTQIDDVGPSQIALLSATNLSGTTVDGLSGGSTTSVSQVGGFMYSKIRYNQFFPAICKGKSTATVLSGMSDEMKELGARRCLQDDDTTWDEEASTQTCAGAADTAVQREIPGFKLYVKLSLGTPYILPTPTSTAKAAQFDNACPDFGTNWLTTQYPSAGYTTENLYDFNGAGDQIQIRVTGVMDYASLGLAELGGISDPYRMICRATGSVQAPAYPVRYYVRNDATIWQVHGRRLNGSEDSSTARVFSAVDADGAAGVKAIAVHPRNLSVYVLKAGAILRYSNCGGQPVDCVMTSGDGLTDQATDLVGAPYQTFTLDTGVALGWIGVDFLSGNVYGMATDKVSVYRLTDSAGTALGLATGDVDPVSFVPLGSDEFPNPMPTAEIMTGFFIAPMGDEAYVTALQNSEVLGATTYDTAIFRALGDNFMRPIGWFSHAIGFSK